MGQLAVGAKDNTLLDDLLESVALLPLALVGGLLLQQLIRAGRELTSY